MALPSHRVRTDRGPNVPILRDGEEGAPWTRAGVGDGAAASWPASPSCAATSAAWLRADVLAGVTVTAYLVPQCLAYAGLAGAPPLTGLWVAVVAMVLYALLGTSRQLSVGPESADRGHGGGRRRAAGRR